MQPPATASRGADAGARERQETTTTGPLPPEHHDHCFVVMPFGRDAAERKHFRGWYEVVIEPAIRAAGLDAILATEIDEPNAINDEIRTHLAYDPVVVVDLGGVTPSDPPNPNVMYELGIRHALDLPLVLMAWEGQRLPFDISNQRALIGGRDLLDIENARRRLVNFISAARRGNFYRPMQAVHRIATVDHAAAASGDALLGAVAEELRELRHAVNSRSGELAGAGVTRDGASAAKLAHALEKHAKRALQQHYLSSGGTQAGWAKFMGIRLDAVAGDPRSWTESRWRQAAGQFIAAREDPAALTGVKV